MARSPRAPWKRPNPRKRAAKKSRHLSPAKKSAAKARARRAGRPYPNLVDNMRMAAKSKKKSAKKSKKTSKKTSKKKSKKTAKKTSRKASRKRAAKKTGRKRAAARKSAGTSGRKRSGQSREKDPRGGLTAAGRKAFARKDGSHLKPGVTKKESEMTPQEMRRKGSWAVRFYGRSKMPPLVDAMGHPTRHALSAHAWGEPVPKTQAAARKIAAKGKRLLEKYQQAKSA